MARRYQDDEDNEDRDNPIFRRKLGDPEMPYFMETAGFIMEPINAMVKSLLWNTHGRYEYPADDGTCRYVRRIDNANIPHEDRSGIFSLFREIGFGPNIALRGQSDDELIISVEIICIGAGAVSCGKRYNNDLSLYIYPCGERKWERGDMVVDDHIYETPSTAIGFWRGVVMDKHMVYEQLPPVGNSLMCVAIHI